MLSSLLVLALTATVGFAAKDADKFNTLPGFVGTLPSTHYSGYIPTGKKSGVAGQLHYWFIESTSKTAASDPVVLWLNGRFYFCWQQTAPSLS